MSKHKEAWGVEVGAQAIKAMKLERVGDHVHMEEFDVMPFKHVLTTPDLNVEEAIRVNLEALAQKHEFNKSHVVVSVPGHMAFARFAKLPPIEASKVKSIVAYEAQQQIPFPIDEVEWDYQVFAQEDAPDIEVGIFAITKERVANFLSNYRAVNMDVDTLTLSPVAVYNAFTYENEGGEGHGSGTVYLDIGTTSTDIIVVEEDSIWLRTLQLGGNHFTNALMKQFKISFAKAEKLKLEAGTSKYAKQIFQAMRGVFSELVTEIQRSLGFYTSLNRDSELTRIVGVGSTWKLPGLQKYLKQNLQMQVMRPDGFARLEVDGRRAAEFSAVAVNMATAYGLALQGLGLGAVDANILPQSILRQRMWNAKRPWIGAAAACVATAPIIGAATYFMDKGDFNSAWEPAKNSFQPTNNEATAFKTEFDTLQTSDPRPEIRNYRRSFDYTNLYPLLMEDVASALATIPRNPALQGVDWTDPDNIETVTAIPRQNRDLVWISSITTEYRAPEVVVVDEYAEGGGDPTADPSAGPGLDYVDPTAGASAGSLTPVPFPAATPAAAPSGAIDPNTGEPIPPPAGETPAAPDPADNPAPRVIVTVTVETTMDRSSIALNLDQFFMAWLEENAERGDRPYVMVPRLYDRLYNNRTSIASAIGTGVDRNSSSSGGLTRQPTRQDDEDDGQPTPPPSFDPSLGEFNEGPGVETERTLEVHTPENWYAQLNGTAGFSMEQVLPQRPLSYETNTQDMVVTFKFEVILLSPDEARATILDTPEEPEDAEPAASRGTRQGDEA